MSFKAAVFLFLMTALAAAQPVQQTIISAVEAEADGQPLQELPAEAEALIGQPYTAYAVRNAVKALYQNHDRYAQIYVYADILEDGTARLMFRLIEKMRVNKVEFAGNRAVSTEELRRAVYLRSRSEYFEEMLNQEEARIEALYRSRGYYQATARAELLNGEENGGDSKQPRDILFHIEEGEPARLRTAELKGELSFDKDTLLTALRLEETAALNDLPDRLIQFYRRRNYFGARVKMETPRYDADANALDIAFAVQEGPQTQIFFEGDLRFDEETLRNAAALERVNARTAQLAQRNLHNFYVEKGYFAADIQTAPLELSDKTASVRFIINPGAELRISEVLFKGNAAFDSGALLRQILTRPRSRMDAVPLLRAFFEDGLFNPQTFEQDKNALKAFYRQEGYPDVQAAGEPRLSNGRLTVEFVIDEGELKTIRAVEIEGAEPQNEERARRLLKTRSGQPYNLDMKRADQMRIQNYYAANGRPYANVRAALDAENDTLRFLIEEGDEARIGTIRVQEGREPLKTRPEVILRELSIREGEPYSDQKINQSRQRLLRLGFFESVEIAMPGLSAQKSVLNANVIVQERPTGLLNVSGGYSPSEGMRGTLEMAQRNWLGTGRMLGLKTRLGTRGNRLEGYFIEPWTLGSRARASLRAFRDNLEEQDDILTWGYSLNLSRELGDYNRAAAQYRYERFRAVDDDSEPLTILPTLSAASVFFTRDTRDNPLNPTRGWFHMARFEAAGGPVLGGKTRILKWTAVSRMYRSFGGASAAAQLRFGYASFGENADRVSSTERFYLGGSSTVRGYAERSLGSRDAFGNYRGNLLALSNLELRIPVKGVFGIGAFVDAGNLWERISDLDKEGLKAAAGCGVRVITPIGPVRADVGFPLSRLRDERQSPRYWIELGNPF